MKEKSFYKSLPFAERRRLRQKQKVQLFRALVRALTKWDANVQINAESEYLYFENQLLNKKLTQDDTVLLDITPDCFEFLWEYASRIPEKYKDKLSVMPYELLKQGAEYFKLHPQKTKSNQLNNEIRQLIISMALRNMTWGVPHIQYSARNVGYKNVKPHHVECILNKNHIPNSDKRTAHGLSWRDFIANAKNLKLDGVITQ